jgi:dTDP-4-dehydrorhamnose reductase
MNGQHKGAGGARRMRMLITGSDGLMGTNILPYLGSQFEVIPSVESEWDIRSPEQSELIIRDSRPDVLLNLAAMTDVDGCEDRQEAAFLVNGEAPGMLAEICSRHGVHMIQVSTDYVFDGKKGSPYTEEDATNPLSVYGRSKKRGEERVLANLTTATIIRTEWIYGNGGANFITKVVKAACSKGSVKVVDDQTGAPTHARDLGRPVAEAARRRLQGVYHVTNSGSCTWYGFAKHIFSFLRMDVPCSPVSSDAYGSKAARPAYSVLDCAKIEAHTGVHMRSWQEALEEYLTEHESDIFLGCSPHRQ